MHVRPSPFWTWYERHYALNVTVATGLFLLQLVHLYWMAAHVVMAKLTGASYFPTNDVSEALIAAVDYTEIPALITTSLIYINDLRKGFRWRPLLFLLFLNSQWLHLFWITDEFVIEHFINEAHATVLPVWLAWLAISIDYLELPVIVDTLRRVILFFIRPAKSRPTSRLLRK